MFHGALSPSLWLPSFIFFSSIALFCGSPTTGMPRQSIAGVDSVFSAGKVPAKQSRRAVKIAWPRQQLVHQAGNQGQRKFGWCSNFAWANQVWKEWTTPSKFFLTSHGEGHTLQLTAVPISLDFLHNSSSHPSFSWLFFSLPFSKHLSTLFMDLDIISFAIVTIMSGFKIAALLADLGYSASSSWPDNMYKVKMASAFLNRSWKQGIMMLVVLAID